MKSCSKYEKPGQSQQLWREKAIKDANPEMVQLSGKYFKEHIISL